MPELPEVEAIVARVSHRATGRTIRMIETLREPTGFPYLDGRYPVGSRISRVYRRGKHVLFELDTSPRMWIDCHNAMSGYWDCEDDPWTFDYVEGPRTAGDHVRLRMTLCDGTVLRFSDARLFGRLRLVDDDGLPRLGPEPLRTKHGGAGAPIMTVAGMASLMREERRPVKVVLMDQAVLAGVGNIYASECCHLAGIDPARPGRSIHPDRSGLLHDALVCVLEHSIPQVRYNWLKVYRRDLCGSCGGSVDRTVLAGRATFSCSRCQGDL